MFEAAGLLAPPSPAQVGLNCHKPLFVEKNSNVTVTRNSDVNLFYLIYIYIFFSFTSGSTFFCRSSSSSALLFTFLLICSMKKFWLELTYLRTIMWHLFYFLILIYFSVLTTVGKSQRQIIMVSQ